MRREKFLCLSLKSQFRKFSGLALLAFAIAAVPSLSHASSINSGLPLSSGTASGFPTTGSTLSVTISGPLATLIIDTGTLTGGPGNFSFTGGTLNVFNVAGHFVDDLTVGGVNDLLNNSFSITASLVPNPPTLTSGSTSFNFTLAENGTNVTAGEASVFFQGSLTPVPEPGTLGMLGTGLVGLAGMARRKLKPGRKSRI